MCRKGDYGERAVIGRHALYGCTMNYNLRQSVWSRDSVVGKMTRLCIGYIRFLKTPSLASAFAKLLYSLGIVGAYLWIKTAGA
jgi:hypothetical protein